MQAFFGENDDSVRVALVGLLMFVMGLGMFIWIFLEAMFHLLPWFGWQTSLGIGWVVVAAVGLDALEKFCRARVPQCFRRSWP